MTFVHGVNDFVKVHPGYLTKMMTALTTAKLCQQFNIKLKEEILTVDWMAACWGGNTIGLKTGDQISVHNLLFGVLLRSTNDACIAIA